MEMPKLKGGQSILLVHKTNDKYDPDGINYCVEWDKEKKSQRWSCYQMTQNSNKQNANRYYGNPQYPFDPELPSGAYFDTDLFYGSGFDLVQRPHRVCQMLSPVICLAEVPLKDRISQISESRSIHFPDLIFSHCLPLKDISRSQFTRERCGCVINVR